MLLAALETLNPADPSSWGMVTTMTIFAVMVILCLISSKISSFFNMPCLLLFLAVGMLAGSEGIGGIPFEDPNLANIIGTAALMFILFSGGFDTSVQSIKKVFLPGTLLSSAGVLLTAAITGSLVFPLFRVIRHDGPDFSLPECFLLGAIISSTDAAAVFSILRSRSVSLRGDLQPLLEYESGSNDPMAAFLTIFMIELIRSGNSSPWVYLQIIPSFFLKMSIGAGCGYLIGKFFVRFFNKIDFEYDGLYYVLGVVAVICAYCLPEMEVLGMFKGNGFMSVYVAGIIMGNSHFIFHNGVGRFYEGLAWLMQVVLFTMLGLLAYPSHVWDAKKLGLGTALILMLIARPLATLICLIRSKFSFSERLLISWVGLRGGAPIMLATFPMMMLSGEDFHNTTGLLFHVVFFIVLSSVLLQGMTIMPLAKYLHLDAPLRKSARNPLAMEQTGDHNSSSCELTVSASAAGMTIAQLKLPKDALILLVRREEQLIVPRGESCLQEGDLLTVMGSENALSECRRIIGSDDPADKLRDS